MKRLFPLLILVLSVTHCGPNATRPEAIPTTEPTPEGLGRTWTRPADGMMMVYVPAGTFEMGSTNGRRDEQPVHTVTLDNFWIDRTEVSNAQYERCVEAGDCDPPGASDSRTRDTYYGDDDYADYPVVKVGWPHAHAYCKWAGARLPTEAEWEYAARGSDGRKYPWGNDDPNCETANYWDPEVNCVVDTTTVGSYPAGASWCGAHDLGGNVWEWIADYYDEYPSEAQVNPTGGFGPYRGMRGGSWYNDAISMRCANRDRDPAWAWFYSVGFRCAKSAE